MQDIGETYLKYYNPSPVWYRRDVYTFVVLRHEREGILSYYGLESPETFNFMESRLNKVKKFKLGYKSLCK